MVTSAAGPAGREAVAHLRASFASTRTMPNAHLDADKDAPLRYDIRLLGRILGETIRAQEGERTFDTIERIRLTAVRFHRDADPSAARELQNNIRTLSNGEAIQIIRAFGHFSHLANTAEDQHHIRRSRAYAIANAAPRKGEIAYALGRARAAALSRSSLEKFFATALCSPVLTAHPTEVRRQSSIDREMEIARLLDERDRIQFTPNELTGNQKALRRAILILWQTNMLRSTRLKVLDEVANGLSLLPWRKITGTRSTPPMSEPKPITGWPR